MRVLRLRYVETVGFRSSEQTNYEALVKRIPGAKHLAAGDVVLFISARGDQLMFVHGFQKLPNAPFECLRSERLRLRHFEGPKVRGRKNQARGRRSRATWDPLMVADYAQAVGIRLENLPLWEQHKRALLERLRSSFEEVDKQIEQARKTTRKAG